MSLPPEQLNKLNETIEDCTSAIKLDDTYIKAYLRRAQWSVLSFNRIYYCFFIDHCGVLFFFFLMTFVWCFSYMDTEQYEEAVRDYEKVYQTEKTSGKRPFVTLCKL